MKRTITNAVVALFLAALIGACSQTENGSESNPTDPTISTERPTLPPPPPANPAITYIDTKQYKYKGVTYNVPSVYVMDADGSHKTMLWNNFTTNGNSGTYGTLTFPKWSGNGQKICFNMYYSGNNDVYTLDVTIVNGVPKASNVTKILAGNSSLWYGRPTWSPTANEIALISFPSANIQRVAVMPSTGGTPVTLYTCASTNYGIDSPCYSPDGTKIGFIMRNNTTQEHWIMVVERSTGNVLSSVSIGSSYRNCGIDWSRISNSTTFALNGNPVSGSQTNLYTLDISVSTTPTQVMSNGTYPSWSPNDSQIAFHNPVGYGISALTLSNSTTTSLSTTGAYPNWKR